MTRRRVTRTPVRLAGIAALTIALSGCGSGGAYDPPNCPVRGIDVSRHQGDIDWRAVAGAGVRFAWIKATEGGDYRDPAFERNWALSRTAGLRRGAYHFVYWCRLAKDQASWFVGNVAADPAALPPVLDVEWNPGSKTCPQKVPRDKALADMKTILDLMQRTYGRRPMIYAPADLYDEVMRGAFAEYPLWARSIGAEPFAAYDRRWTLWQYSETGKVAGVRGDVDLNCFNGGDRAWRDWARMKD